jgi:hypothetical protein
LSTSFRAQLFTADTIDQLDWPKTDDGNYAKRFLIPMVKKGPGYFIDGLQTEMMVIQLGDLVFPVTINDQEYQNSYVCSPYNHYITYAKEELKNLKSPILEGILEQVLNLVGRFLKAGKINRVIIVNNWLISTNLYPMVSEGQILEIVSFLQKRFPGHSILFRSLSPFKNLHLPNIFTRAGGKLLMSRQVYFLDPNNSRVWTNKSYKRDLSHYKKSIPEMGGPESISKEDYSRIVQLYRLLYIDKYSVHNPLFNAHLVELAHQKQILELKVFREGGVIQGVLGFFIRHGQMTTPLFGYDTTLPLDRGLYRVLSTHLVHEAKARNLFLHQSSGAAEFKRSRGAVAELEFTAIFDSHLPFYRRWTWNFLRALINGVGSKLLERYEL